MHVFVIFSADFFHANAVDKLCDVIFFSSATVGEYFYSFLFAYKHHQMSPCRSQRLQRNLHNLISPVTSTHAFCLSLLAAAMVWAAITIAVSCWPPLKLGFHSHAI
jgi:hypothetical protein